MSFLLKQLVGDSDDEEFSNDDSDNDEFIFTDEQDDDELLGEEDENKQIEQTKTNLTFKNLSDRKKELKHNNKHAKSKLKENHCYKIENQVLEISEEEMQHYQKLKLYGISGPPKNEQEEINEEINFKLDVLQSSKMFYETINPTMVTIYSGNRSYDERYRYLCSNSYKIQREKGYENSAEMFAAELTHPRLIVNEYPRAKSFEYVQQLLNRTEHMSCLSSDSRYLYIYGGKTRNVVRDDFIIYDIPNAKMHVYNNLHLASHLENYQATNIIIPQLCGYVMLENDGILYIIGKGDTTQNTTIYTIENIRDPMEVRNGYAMGYSWTYYHVNTMFPSRTNCSMNHFKSSNLEIYLFGGKYSNRAVDEMIILQIPIQKVYKNPATFTRIEKPKVGDWPCARYGHSSCMIANLIFIYGGMNNRNQLLNDLYMFDTTTQVWTEISVESMLPPPLYRHQSFSVNNQSFYILGGQTKQGSSSSLFRFDIIDKKWSLIEVISDERNRTLSGHQCLVVTNKLYIIGGNADQENNVSEKTSFNVLSNINDPGKQIPICNYLTTKRKEGYLCDIVFRVKDQMSEVDTTSYILAHKCILKARCPYLTEKLSSGNETMSCGQFEGTFLTDEIEVKDISECNAHIFEKYIEYLYTGSLYLENLEEVNQFLDFVKRVSTDRHYPSIQQICTLDTRKDLGLTQQILNDMHKDLTTLIDDNTYSDLIVVLDQENQFKKDQHIITDEQFDQDELLSPLTSSSLPSSGISVHRLIMSRSPFFSRMLVTSGMMETKEKVVHLTDYSKEVMIDMLKYLYTDIIQLSPSNCLGILVYSLMFDLNDLASCCRRMVISLLDNSTVWTVHEIAVLYNEKSLESECEHYIANNYSTLSTSSGFLDLPDLTRMKIKQMHEKKCSKKKF